MKLHRGYEWHIFQILTNEVIADVILLFFIYFFYFQNVHIYLVKRKLHALSCEIFFPWEDKLHMFKPPCTSSLYNIKIILISCKEHSLCLSVGTHLQCFIIIILLFKKLTKPLLLEAFSRIVKVTQSECMLCVPNVQLNQSK